MSLSVSSSNGVRPAESGNSVDLSKLTVDAKKIASRNPGPKQLGASPVVRTALGPSSVGLKPDEVKALATSFLPVAQNIVDSTFAAHIKSAPQLQLKFWTAQQMKANNPGENMDGTVAYTDTGRPGIINVGFQSPAFKKLNVDARDLKMFLVHEVMHTRSVAFSTNMGETYGKPLANGKPPAFSDGSAVRGITEGLTEIYTLMATSQKVASSTYNREIKWAVKLIEKVGADTMANAYFGNDPASMARVKKAINELVAADKPAAASARSL